MTQRSSTAEEMIARVAAGDVRALARSISLVEDGDDVAPELLALCATLNRRAVRIGITGPPGAGKSTLVDQMVRQLRARGRTLGVLAVDPSSPLTGGALLGDRIRIHGFASDAGVYIRSLASRGAMGGLSETAADVLRVMEASGRDPIIIETVGIGQDEVAITALADVTLLLLVPGLGDDIQALKAGVMEVADIFVVNKADVEGADRVAAQTLDMQTLTCARSGWTPPAIKTNASSGEGVAELLDAIDRFMAQKGAA